ncbi:DUF5979 domain-containing protein [Corynebacterium felinum]|uniref:DUF5979 domain-containing protein n=1 Tax=Corynebacterium felinum TaxID=131318 RepID=A0ABU2B792_9CORY|nr:DUF5979 domain-containing protein [Corynebacterium felinum]MDF5820157.1 DUF5979 domain-containing protein [Corynebacterium felinum]MDR7353909.1 hypothetical protein [Corynebacterium felinum]WJY96082.1 hypothetical protein CFELI_12510 [Corynebacterium felinum]
MGQLSTLRMREMLRLCAVVVTLTLVGSLLVVLNPAHAGAQASSAPTGVNRTADFATKIDVRHKGKKPGETGTLEAGSIFNLDFYWAVGEKELPEPGDYMQVTFPEWMSPYGRGIISAGPYTDCSYDPRKNVNGKITPAVLTCVFTDAVRGENNRNVHGDVHMEISAVATDTPETIQWGLSTHNVVELLTGNPDSEIGTRDWQPGGPNQPNMKRGWFSSEFTSDGVRYQQVLWSLVFKGTGGDVKVHDKLGDVTINDPVAGTITVPQFFAPSGKGGGFTIARRKENVKGHWGLIPTDKDNTECRVDGSMVNFPDARCAELIANVRVTKEKAVNQPQGVEEVVVIDEGLGQPTDEQNNEFTITVRNTKNDHYYRFAMYTWIPAEKLPKDELVSTTFATNTAEVDGVAVNTDQGAKLYQRAWGRSVGEPNSTQVIISKKVLQGGAEISSDELKEKVAREKFPVDVFVDGVKQDDACTTLSVAHDCKIKIKAGQSLKLVEPKPADSDWAVWKDGVFSVPPAAVQESGKDPASKITLEGNTLTIAKGEGGDLINVLITNDFGLTGQVKVAKKLEGIVATPVPSFDFDYRCVHPTDQTKVISGTKKVLADGKQVELVGSVPMGYKCVVKETEDNAQLNFNPGYVLKNRAQNWEFTVTEVNNARDFVNVYEKRAGKISIAKNVGPEMKTTDHTFNFRYTCVDPQNVGETKTGTKAVAGNGAMVELATGIPFGYSCTVEETDDKAALNFNPNFIIDAPAANWTFTVDKAAHEHTFVNHYRLNKGKVVVAKKLGGDATSTDKTFDVNLRCTDPAGLGPAIVVKKPVPGNGTEVELANEIPFGYACVVAETDDKKQLDFDPDNFVLDTPAAKWEFVVNSPVHSQVLTNTYRKQEGSFTIAKTTAGLLPGLGANKEFVFDVRCDDGQNASVKVKGDGVAVASGITAKLGTTCTVTEKPEGADVVGFNLTLPEPKTVEILAKDQAVTVTFVNNYSIMGWIPLVAVVVPFLAGVLSALPNLFPAGTERVLSKTPESAAVKPGDKGEAKKGIASQAAPKQEAAKGAGLANTGASVLGLLAVAVALIVLGVVLVRRKKS